MRKRTRSLLEELNAVHGSKDNDYLIETTANNIIESSINLLSRIHNNYDIETATDLERKFLNSIKSGDARKFRRTMQKIIEGKNNDS
jgi:anthranilate phosphoribosyltransferase